MCTGITLTTQDGATVRGRTLEFGTPMNSNLIAIPAGIAITGTGPDGSAGGGLAWTTKHGTIGLSGVGKAIAIDGLNDQGLSGGIFYFPQYTGYMDVKPHDAKKSVAPWEVITWALTQFATVAEVKAALPSLLVNAATLDTWGFNPPMHYYFADASGGRMAVEYIGGELKTHDAPFGVITNAPPYDWHMINLGNYIYLQGKSIAGLTVEDVKILAPSTGTNTVGLPGDFGAPARFVKAVMYSSLLPKPADAAKAVEDCFHLLDQFDVPEGAVPEAPGSTPPNEVTEWTSVADMTNGQFYVWTQHNRNVRRISLSDPALKGNAIVEAKLNQVQEYVDIAMA